MEKPSSLSETEEKIIDDLMRYLRYAIIAVGVILGIQACPAIRQVESGTAVKILRVIQDANQ